MYGDRRAFFSVYVRAVSTYALVEPPVALADILQATSSAGDQIDHIVGVTIGIIE